VLTSAIPWSQGAVRPPKTAAHCHGSVGPGATRSLMTAACCHTSTGMRPEEGHACNRCHASSVTAHSTQRTHLGASQASNICAPGQRGPKHKLNMHLEPYGTTIHADIDSKDQLSPTCDGAVTLTSAGRTSKPRDATVEQSAKDVNCQCCKEPMERRHRRGIAMERAARHRRRRRTPCHDTEAIECAPSQGTAAVVRKPVVVSKSGLCDSDCTDYVPVSL
jgi:hypothetical protein